ncbi:MAG TPA: ATP-dependent helicase HrpB [Steroidobacteraceae bacterium]|nr:ATP-dependent helicase HrpB [Steroidobacteraceae bacterium]
MRELTSLPVEAVLPRLLEALRAVPNAVLVAPPGAGKSTVVPLALLDEPWARGRRILLLEPRRLAARAVAGRMADTLGERVGETVGYRMRLDTKVGPRTRLEVLTEGILTRMLQQDPALEGVAAVLFDEFHERSLNADLGLALCREAQQSLDLPLKLLVMSATIDGAAVAARLGDAPVIEAQGRMFPVEVRHLGKGLPALPEQRTLAPRAIDTLAAQARRVLDESEGDVLMFVPGSSEIHRLRAQLEQAGIAGLDVHALHGELPLEAQHRVLAPAVGGRRKLILATNIAETSLTIEGVRVVIDTGLARRSLFDPGTGMERLVTARISQASAAQRAGRAGRTAPGSAWRLWGEGAEASLAAHAPPEILTSDLAPLALELAQWGARDANTLPWMDAPPAATLAQARQLLQRLTAIDASFAITPTGCAMLATGLHPRLAHMLVRARTTPFAALAATLAALLSERDLLRAARDPDVRTRLEALRGAARGIDPAALARVREVARRLGGSGHGAAGDGHAGAVLAWAYPDRIAQLRAGSGGAAGQRYLLANGRGALLEGASTLTGCAYLVALDLDDADAAEARIRLAAPLTREQLEESLVAAIAEGIETDMDPKSGALRARRVRRLDALVLEEHRVEPDPERVAAALLDQVRRVGLDVLPWGEAGTALRARLRFAAAHRAGTRVDLPPLDEAVLLEELPQWLGPYLHGLRSLDRLPPEQLREALLSRLTHAQRRQLDEFAPTHVTVPTGSRIAVDYLDDNAPAIEVRMQEVFGLADTPRIAGGSVPVTLKLLSPARRPMQITRDLAGFWKGSYAGVRKDMRGRYPRHYWPENPLEAEPVRGVRPRKG